VTSQCPSKKHGPLRRTKCGRRERESRREGRGEQSLRDSIPSRVVTVKGILVFWKAALFAGRRRNEDLGWSVSSAAVPCCKRARRRQRMSEGRRGGERRRHAPQSACTRRRHERSSQANRGRVLRSVLRPVHVNPHYALEGQLSLRWGVRVGITVGQTHASEKNHHWGRHGRTERGSPRITASARERAWFVRKGRRSRPSSLRGSWGARVWLPARRSAVAEVSRRRLVSNKLGKRAPKRAVRVELTGT